MVSKDAPPEIRARVVTPKQRMLAQKLAENAKNRNAKTQGEILLECGYSQNVAKNPHAIVDAPGVKYAMWEIGFNPETAMSIVGEILVNGKEENRIRAADQVFKVFGTYAPTNVNLRKSLEPFDDIEDAEIIAQLEELGIKSESGLTDE